MTSLLKSELTTAPIEQLDFKTERQRCMEAIEQAWSYITAQWPLKPFAATNPLQAFEALPFEEALANSDLYFDIKECPADLLRLNEQTLKWCQVLFDDQQAFIRMPGREKGLYHAWIKLAAYDSSLHLGEVSPKAWFKKLSDDPVEAVEACLKELNLPDWQWKTFLTLMLTTLPGWASHVKFKAQKEPISDDKVQTILLDFLAIRCVLAVLLNQKAFELIEWFERKKGGMFKNKIFLKALSQREDSFSKYFLKKIHAPNKTNAIKERPKGQWVFCIDVRSQTMRRSLESLGGYETYSMAGFFSVATAKLSMDSKQPQHLCPVIVQPDCTVTELKLHHGKPVMPRISRLKHLFKQLKYAFTTPFALAESTGLAWGLWMALKSFCPSLSFSLQHRMKKIIHGSGHSHLNEEGVTLEYKVLAGLSALKSIGLTSDFARWVFICGHKSVTENNAFDSSLQCGACGGYAGDVNAQLLAQFLNDSKVREALSIKGIDIPADTTFVGVCHNTTTHELTVHDMSKQWLVDSKEQAFINEDLKKAQLLSLAHTHSVAVDQVRPQTMKAQSLDWAQIRPEWGLVNNAAFFIGPIARTKGKDFDGRVFLHSYDYEKDQNLDMLTSIMTAPMVVGFWINMQYFFSTYQNNLYGAGSKQTKNVWGKSCIMQGNASDLMHGLPLESVYQNDKTPYHDLVRLQCYIVAPCDAVLSIIKSNELLLKLTTNKWLNLYCEDSECWYRLDSNQIWEPIYVL